MYISLMTQRLGKHQGELGEIQLISSSTIVRVKWDPLSDILCYVRRADFSKNYEFGKSSVMWQNNKKIDSSSHLIRRTLIGDFKICHSNRSFFFALLRDLFLNSSEQQIEFR